MVSGRTETFKAANFLYMLFLSPDGDEICRAGPLICCATISASHSDISMLLAGFDL
jgi:hypothetical protein